jgi:hypothetical protein
MAPVTLAVPPKMASNREIVLLAGQLKGMGRVQNCMISAIKASLPSSNSSEYVELTIQDTPLSLPDGEYDLIFKGRTVPLQKRGSEWLSLVEVY